MIDRLELTNFKAFRRLDLPLAPYTVLSGLNSSGKSTVMQSLALLRQSHDRGTLDSSDGGFLLNGDLVELGVGQDVLHEDYMSGDDLEVRIGIALTAGVERQGWLVAYDKENELLAVRTDRRFGERRPVRFGSRAEDDMGRRVARGPRSLFGPYFQYLKADRVVPAVTYPRSNEVAVRRRFLGARGEHTVNYLRHFQDEPVASAVLHPAARSSQLLDQTEAWMQEICPGVNLQAVGIEGTDQVRLSFQFGTAGLSSSNRYRPTNVGFGLTYVLPIVVACLTARPDSLILLENPEAHVHPRGQTAMARLTCAATAAGAQVIVETHSDHILNGLRIAVKQGLLTPEQVALHYFRRVAGKIEITTPTVGSDGMLSSWPDGFFDEWDRSLDELLD